MHERVETFIRERELIEPGGEVTCLVSGGADSTCLWHALRSLEYRVSTVHVNHKLRGAESEKDAAFCADVLGAEVVELDGRDLTEAELRWLHRREFARTAEDVVWRRSKLGLRMRAAEIAAVGHALADMTMEHTK